MNALLSEYFDAEWYRAKYPDIRGTDAEAYDHFVRHGAAERRNPCAEFDSNDYLTNHPDVGDTPIVHYLLHGRDERRSPKNYCVSEIIAENIVLSVYRQKQVLIPPKICCLIHVYYIDLLDELLSYAENINFDKDVIVNLVSTTWSLDAHSSILKRFPGAKIIISPDLGRDIGGFVRMISAIDIGQYDIFFFAHSKKSPHLPESLRSQMAEGTIGAARGHAASRGTVRVAHAQQQSYWLDRLLEMAQHGGP